MGSLRCWGCAYRTFKRPFGAAPTGYDPLLDSAPELASTTAASVQEHDTNSDGVYTFTHPWSDGTTGIRL